MREKLGTLGGGAFVDRVVREGAGALRVLNPAPDIRDYVGMALEGAFPQPALRLGERARRRWYDGYVQQLLTRDATEAEPGRDPVRLRRYFEALALNTAGAVDQVTLMRAAGIDRRTAVAYEHLLSNLYVLDIVPAWFTNRLKRLGQHPKRYLVDPALASSRHLLWLRDELGDRFSHGLILHSGHFIQEIDERITAAPIAVLWS